MKDIINGLIERFRRQHVQARRYVAMMLVLALLTTLFVNWQLHGCLLYTSDAADE